MLSNFWTDPIFWICIALTGFLSAVAVFCTPALKSKFMQFPKPFRRVILLSFFVAPLFALPLTSQPRLPLPTSTALLMGIPLLAGAAVVKILAQKQIGASPGLLEKQELVTTGIYGIIRHPLYLGNILFATGWALVFKAAYALLFTPILAIGYLAVAFFEERELEKEFGEKYREYKKRVPWRLIPKIF